MTKHLLLVSGPQGSGKSTQAERIAERYQLPLFKAGAQLRAYADSDKPGAAELKAALIEGQLAPHHYVDNLFLNFIEINADRNGYITEGYPRSLDNWHIIEKVCTGQDIEVIGINITIPEETTFERISKRVEVKNGEAQKRADDSPEAIRERLRIYHTQTQPVLDRIKQDHRLFVIDGSPAMDSVSQAIFAALDPILKRQ